ncbi:hypothetical protein TPHA_0D00150 [Tetrapisispora phaffii CBS 4417]|uniref:Protein transport protein BOS1 n=1 Tax=Tetrapisispora phaffii (strain ATCC 24235 / CBS 4417 / NBRC 1672 / NRRL Y-8282 / UCD 70-5) TaxID=1071381 RepID=G8BS38_TETPH|nr:hypothetical protein TPHA_0D00150 [Tetrapisispora phaffii CBS 4417]CCE62659.1 hypothetical protein TPHA_0D00150 [Tetrapisispora phaffii CBS 4417]
MNAIYNHAVKQKNQLRDEIAKFESNLVTAPISLQGSISATLVSFEKSINQYKEQVIKFQKENGKSTEESVIETIAKGGSRLESLINESKELTTKYKELKQKYNEANARTELFANTSSTENPFNDASAMMNKRNVGVSQTSSNVDSSNQAGSLPMYDGLLKEQNIFQKGNAQLDLILEMGQQSLEDIMEQNEVLKKVQDRMSSSLRTLGVSEETIHQINKRVFKDKLIFWIALFLLFLGMYLILKWLR